MLFPALRAVVQFSLRISKMILVGGSSDTDMDNVNNTVVAIQEALELVTWASSQDSGLEEKNWKVPVVLFPQGAAALSPAADAITFMMLMNSKSPKYLIEEQVAGSLFIKKSRTSPGICLIKVDGI